MKKIKLGVNIDHVATLRQARLSSLPDPCLAAAICERAGADSIVAHLREDRRHIQDKDIIRLRKTIRTRLNLEMSACKEILKIACKVKPDQATLVPEKRKELTTEGGLNMLSRSNVIKDAAIRLMDNGIAVSLFIDPDPRQIERAARYGIKMVELHTGRYADARNLQDKRSQLKKLAEAAAFAHDCGLRVFAGHGLDYANVKSIAALPYMEELNIGYSIICRSIITGLHTAVKDMKRLI